MFFFFLYYYAESLLIILTTINYDVQVDFLSLKKFYQTRSQLIQQG